MNWIHLENFNAFSSIELYQLLRLRQDIFIIEQKCIYDDIDDIDPYCEHLLLKDQSGVIGCSRLVPANKKFEFPSIGRIAVHKEFRGKGLGRNIVKKSIELISRDGAESIIIEAQSYLKSFYESLGFEQVSESYMVDDIPHIKMIYTF